MRMSASKSPGLQSATSLLTLAPKPGAGIDHFEAPSDIVAALKRMAGQGILSGNLDPATIFHDGTPDSVRTAPLHFSTLRKTKKNFIFSSGRDIPPGKPLANLEAFHEVALDLRDRLYTSYLPA
jgi:uroporphyrinogen-III decarboxylase